MSVHSTDRRPGNGTPRPERRWSRRRVVLAVASAVVMVALTAGLVLVTDIGAPRERYAAAPEPCDLLSDATVAGLLGTTRPSTVGARSERGGGLHRVPDQRWCITSGDGTGGGTLSVFTYRFHGTQLRLGPDGARRAADHYTAARDLSLDLHHTGCAVTRQVAEGDACAVPSDTGFALHVQRENVYVNVDLLQRDPGTADPWPDTLLEAVTEEVLAGLNALA